MGYKEDFKLFAENKEKCKNCKFYDTENKNLNLSNILYRGKIAICINKHSGMHKVSDKTLCCEFYETKGE